MAERSIGEQELALLRYIADRGSLTVGEAADQFGAARGLARSTVLTMMERLRRKGQLGRRSVDGVYRYRARTTSADLIKRAVRRFVERNLDGSVSPFLAYLSEAEHLSDAELRELEDIVAWLQSEKGSMMLSALLRASVEGAVFVGILWLVTRLVPTLSPATRTILWWSATAKFVISLLGLTPVILPILPNQSTAAAPAAITRFAAAARRFPSNPVAVQTSAADATLATSTAWPDVVIALWFVGVVSVAGLGRRRWRQVRNIVRRSIPAPGHIQARAHDLARPLQLTRVPEVRLSEEIEAPLVAGLVRPVVLLPTERFTALSVRQQSMALCHELAHVKRGDLWMGCVPAVSERLFFFHPLAHLAAREYAHWREAACDASVLATLDAAPQEYGRLLLDLGISRRPGAFVAAGTAWSFSSLKRRIAMLQRFGPPDDASDASATTKDQKTRRTSF